MLGGDGEPAGARLVAGKPVFQHVGLLDDLPRVRKEPRSVFGGHDALAGTLEDGDAHLGLKLGDGLRERWLRDEETLRCGGNRSGRCDLNYVAKLLECHGCAPLPELAPEARRTSTDGT